MLLRSKARGEVSEGLHHRIALYSVQNELELDGSTCGKLECCGKGTGAIILLHTLRVHGINHFRIDAAIDEYLDDKLPSVSAPIVVPMEKKYIPASGAVNVPPLQQLPTFRGDAVKLRLVVPL